MLVKIFILASAAEELGPAMEGRRAFLAGGFNNWLGAKAGKIVPDAQWELFPHPDGTWGGEFEVPPGTYDFKPVRVDDCPPTGSWGARFARRLRVHFTAHWVHWRAGCCAVTPSCVCASGSDAPGGPNWKLIIKSE